MEVQKFLWAKFLTSVIFFGQVFGLIFSQRTFGQVLGFRIFLGLIFGFGKFIGQIFGFGNFPGRFSASKIFWVKFLAWKFFLGDFGLKNFRFGNFIGDIFGLLEYFLVDIRFLIFSPTILGRIFGFIFHKRVQDLIWAEFPSSELFPNKLKIRPRILFRKNFRHEIFPEQKSKFKGLKLKKKITCDVK